MVEIDLLIKQALDDIRSQEVSAQAPSRARYHQKQMGNEAPFYMRQFGGTKLGGHIVLRFSPPDTMFKRRCSITLCARQFPEDAMQKWLSGVPEKHGFTQKEAATPGHALFSNGAQAVEISLFFKDKRASISIRHA